MSGAKLPAANNLIPMTDEDWLRLAIETCKTNPKWQLSLQTHKLLQIP